MALAYHSVSYKQRRGHVIAKSAMQTILNSVSGEYLCVVSVLGVFAISIVVAFVVWRIARRDDVTS